MLTQGKHYRNSSNDESSGVNHDTTSKNLCVVGGDFVYYYGIWFRVDGNLSS